ncbi:hypothetical protein M0805_007082 [Coniferiporia weirii]|nr:hypothetical protein M0805_007082 [Coniferiporia weirii]
MSMTISTLNLSGLWDTEFAGADSDTSSGSDVPQVMVDENGEIIAVPQQLARRLDSYDVVGGLGCGQTGSVYLAQRFQKGKDGKIAGTHCALKVVKRSALDAAHKNLTLNEVKVLSKLRSTGFMGMVQLEESMCDAFNRYIVMELGRGGTLYDAIDRADGPLDATHVRCITAELVHALLFLKSQGIVHRDIKPENILLTARGRTVLADFGIAADVTETSRGAVSGACGTPGYMAPEVMARMYYSFAADAFSLGCTIFYCLAGECPYDESDYEQCRRRTFTEALVFPDTEGFCYYTKHFISSLLEKHASSRLKLEDAKDTAYLEGINWDRVAKGDYDMPEEWIPPSSVTTISNGTLDKDILHDKSKYFLPWTMDADERAFVMPLHADAGRREWDEIEMADLAQTRLERDARKLFAMPDDDIPAALQLEAGATWGLGSTISNSLGRSSGLSVSSPPRTTFFDDEPGPLFDDSSAFSIRDESAEPEPVREAPVVQEVHPSPRGGPASPEVVTHTRLQAARARAVRCRGEFVPRLVPDPHGEIPEHFNEEQVRLCERYPVDIRGLCTERGLSGLGLANVPELALTMSAATLVTAPVTPVGTWPQRQQSKSKFAPRLPPPEPVFRASQLPTRMRMRLFVSDLKRAVRRLVKGRGEEGGC